MPELSSLGVECAAIVGSDGPLGSQLGGLGVEARSVDLMASRLNLQGIRELRATLADLRPDVVHAHGTRGAFSTAAARPAVPWVYTAHGLSYRQAGGYLHSWTRLAAETFVCRTASRVVTVSAADLRDLRRRRLLGAESGVHIPNGIDTARFAPGDRNAARAHLDLPSEPFVVGTVSRLVAGKAVDDLIEAVLSTLELRLVIAGDGPMRGQLEALAARGGDRVRFLGPRDDVPDVLRALDVFVLPSLWEGEPVALLEAMACGLACVATSTSGAKEVLQEGKLGVLVDIGKPEAISDALLYLQRNPTARAQLGTEARRGVEGRSWLSVATRLAAIYAEITAQ